MANDSRDGHPSKTDGSFGTVESRAQSDDARETSSTPPGEVLNVYKLIPIAAPNDLRWQNSPGHGVVLVAARSSGDARIVAAGRELDFMEIDAAPAEDVTTSNASAFRSEKLYTVLEVEKGRTDLARGVLSGTITVDTIKPTQL